jgi:hypothetical protein
MEIWKEKWNYSPVFIGKISDKTKSDFLLPKIAEIYNVSSLPWNDFESYAVTQILNASENLFKLNGLRPIKVHNEQIIILDKDVFKDKLANSEEEVGKCSNGYIYVCRNEDRSKFLCDLAHELSHLFSFYSLAIKEEGGYRFIDVWKRGFSLIKENDKFFYDGLNEAATDLWSKVVLQKLFISYPDILDKEKKDEALNYYAYPFHASLLEELISKMTSNNILIWPLFKSYFDGSSDFLNLLKNELPTLVKPIKTMTSEKESALKVAEIIGGCLLLKKIRNIYPGAK